MGDTPFIATKQNLPSSSHPNSIVKAALAAAISLQHATFAPVEPRGLSVQYRAFESQFLMNGRPKLPSTDAGAECHAMIKAGRAARVTQFTVPFDAAASIEAVVYGGVQCYWISYPHQQHWSNKQQPYIVYHHGGGFIAGSILTHAGISAQISKTFDLPLLYVEYTLVPEALFPKQRDEVIAVHRALLEIDATAAERMIIYGDSAGGALALLLTQAALSLKLAVPAACIAVSPWVSYTGEAISNVTNASVDWMMTTAALVWDIEVALGGKQHMLTTGDTASNTIMSPMNHSFKGFPPTYIIAGGAELLTTDSEMTHAACVAAGVDVTLRVVPHMCHIFFQFPSLFPEAATEMETAIKWLRSKLKITAA